MSLSSYIYYIILLGWSPYVSIHSIQRYFSPTVLCGLSYIAIYTLGSLASIRYRSYRHYYEFLRSMHGYGDVSELKNLL